MKGPIIFLVMVFYLITIGKGHPCDRSCDDSRPMICNYEFTLEWYSTLSKACFDCPSNKSDCYRKDCIVADGVQRDITVVNKMLPGPAITVCLNDTIRVTLHNKLDNNEGTAIHWHGMYQQSTPWMDGVPLVTQCPIPSGTSFIYNFAANPGGTHWWHSHAGFQRSDGSAGAIIVKTPTTINPHAHLYDVDNENFIVFIGDWLHKPTMTKYLRHHHADGNNKGESILINGRGRFDESVSNQSQSAPITEYFLREGLRYRFRIISNAAVYCPIEIVFEQHVMTVIATDGTDIQPAIVSSLFVHGGERYDVIVTANRKPSNYLLKAQGKADCRNNSQIAILRYFDGGDSSSSFEAEILRNETLEFPLLNPLNQAESFNVKYVTSLTSTKSNKVMRKTPDDVIFIGFDFKKVDNPKYHHPILYPIKYVSRNNHLYTPQINNVTWVSPHSPLLTQPERTDPQSLCNTHTETRNLNNTAFRACTHVIDLPLHRLVELVLFDEGFTFDAGHPMHLHGQHFAVVAMDRFYPRGNDVTVQLDAIYIKTLAVNSSLSLDKVKHLYHSGSIRYVDDLTRSVLKDTVIVPDGGYVIVRFYTENPGYWLFHCHLAFHLEAGMTMVFHVGEKTEVPTFPPDFPKCGDWPERDWMNISQSRSRAPCSDNGSARKCVAPVVWWTTIFAFFCKMIN